MSRGDSKFCFSGSADTPRNTLFRFWVKFRGGKEHTETTKGKSRKLLGPGFVRMLEAIST
jgi:hypothetical protein